MKRKAELPELNELLALIEGFGSHCRVKVLGSADWEEVQFPIHALELGSEKPEAPILFISAGVHGLERIGTHVALAFLRSLKERLEWDEVLRWELKSVRIATVPIVNPIGMWLKRRSNGNHVDLMRNAPVVAPQATWLVGGQRWSKHLPWFRGTQDAEMELEARLLCSFVKEVSFGSKAAVLLDLHSGFGQMDQLWFPFARSTQPFPGLAEVFGLKTLLDRVLPNHIYRFEPQALNYVTHGDLWDHLYDLHSATKCSGLFLPLTLEMGSWSWIRKNPTQLFSFRALQPGEAAPLSADSQKASAALRVPASRALFTRKLDQLRCPSKKILERQALALWYPGLALE